MIDHKPRMTATRSRTFLDSLLFMMAHVSSLAFRTHARISWRSGGILFDMIFNDMNDMNDMIRSEPTCLLPALRYQPLGGSARHSGLIIGCLV